MLYSPAYPLYGVRQAVPAPLLNPGHLQHPQDERFFPFLLPFVAGLAGGTLLFAATRPFYPPPYMPPYAAGPGPAYYPYQSIQQPYQPVQQPYAAIPSNPQTAINENITIYNNPAQHP